MVSPTLVFSKEDLRLRERIRAWIEDHDQGFAPSSYGDRSEQLIEWQRELHAAGFIGLSWPTRYGGHGQTLASEAVLAEALAKSSKPELINRLALYTWGPTVLDEGTEAQKGQWLRPMLDASEIWCQGFSEPDAGSDLAAVRTQARLQGDELVISGQKVWTSRAEFSRWNAMLVRTDPSSERHAGLSVVVVDMQTPGVTVRPLYQILHEPHFSEVFLDEVRVPVDNVLGGLGQGWRVAMKAMGYERGLFVLERQIRLRRRLVELATTLAARGLTSGAAAALGRLEAQLEMLGARAYYTLAAQIAGDVPKGATSVDKLLLEEVYQQLFGLAFDHLGGEIVMDDPDGWGHDLLESRSVSIYSGTTQIQRNIVARQLLGLAA